MVLPRRIIGGVTTMIGIRNCRIALLASALAAGITGTAPAFAQDQDRDDEIVVTAQMRQGGAQDIRHFRSVSLDGSFLPEAASLTLEGLLGEHDLTLPVNRTCAQVFCLTGHAMAASLPTRPQDRWFVGLGFDSAIDAEQLQRAPLSLIAVVDRSGSMGGAPIMRVKDGLREVLSHMRKGDRLGIVIYGSNTVVHLPVTDVDGHRDAIARAIDGIAIDGATYMEAGLQLGYETGFAELASSQGKTRLMLFTDENPNVGNTSPQGFMAMAEAASRRGIGLTTIGVGVHFDAALATKVSSVRGGNLFFLDPARPARELYDKEFRNMVSEVAHDIVITMTPPAGWKVSGVFGVPDGLMEAAPEGAVTVRIASAFLSSNGGGIYATLAPDASRDGLPVKPLADGAPVLDASLTYVDAMTGQPKGDRLAVMAPTATPKTLAKAQVLVDEYLSVTKALALFHGRYDKKGAFSTLDGLSQRLASAGAEGLADERKLVDGLRDRAALVAGYGGELPKELRPIALLGRWKVTSQSGMTDIARGDLVEITGEEEFITTRTSGRNKGDEIVQPITVNERQVLIKDANLILSYRRSGDRLNLTTQDGQAWIHLQRIAEAEAAGNAS